MKRRGLSGDAPATLAMLLAIEAAPKRRVREWSFDLAAVLSRAQEMEQDSAAEKAACRSGLAVTLDRYRDTARNALEPRPVELALARLGEWRPTLDEQRTVGRGARTP